MLLYHCYHFKYIELNMISLKSVVELLLLNMWQTSSGIKEDNFDFVSKFDMLKRWSPSSLFTTPNGKYWVHSISLFKMILLAAHFIVKTCSSDTKAQILEWWMKGWFPYPVKPSFFCSCLCFKRVCKWGKTFKG